MKYQHINYSLEVCLINFITYENFFDQKVVEVFFAV